MTVDVQGGKVKSKVPGEMVMQRSSFQACQGTCGRRPCMSKRPCWKVLPFQRSHGSGRPAHWWRGVMLLLLLLLPAQHADQALWCQLAGLRAASPKRPCNIVHTRNALLPDIHGTDQGDQKERPADCLQRGW